MRSAVVGHVEFVQFARVERVPSPGDIVHAHEWWEEAAGGGAAAAVQLLKLSGDATFLTALGEDYHGRRAYDELSAKGLRVEVAWRSEPTRRAVTHIDAAGSRTITVLGKRLGPRARDPLPWQELRDVDAVYFTAGDEGALHAVRQARVLVATARVLPLLRECAVPIDAIVASESDPAEAYEPGDLDPAPSLAVWTGGSKGGRFLTARGWGRYRAFPPPGPIVDEYGAGDAFAAGLTYGLGRGDAPRMAVELAARCGSSVVTGRGPYEGQLIQPRS